MVLNISQKLNTAASYLVRPNTYPFLNRLVKTKILGGSMSLDQTKEQASTWCSKQALSTPETILKITGQEIQTPLRSRFAEVFAAAEERVSACPQQMGGAGNLDLLYAVAQHLSAARVIETGVAYGWSSLAILLSLADQSTARLISTNLQYSQHQDNSYVGCAVLDQLKPFWTIIHEADRTALPKALAMLPECDLCHYDSDKTYGGRLWAYPLLWEALRIGGCFISDDVGDNLAFAHFCQMLSLKPTIVKMLSSSGEKYIGLLVKTSAAQPRQIMF